MANADKKIGRFILGSNINEIHGRVEGEKTEYGIVFQPGMAFGKRWETQSG